MKSSQKPIMLKGSGILIPPSDEQLNEFVGTRKMEGYGLSKLPYLQEVLGDKK